MVHTIDMALRAQLWINMLYLQKAINTYVHKSIQYTYIHIYIAYMHIYLHIIMHTCLSTHVVAYKYAYT